MIIQALGDPVIQAGMWIIAGYIFWQSTYLIDDLPSAWSWIGYGLMLYGIRVGYKLLPFYKASEVTEAGRYVLGIVAALLLLVGFIAYYREMSQSQAAAE